MKDTHGIEPSAVDKGPVWADVEAALRELYFMRSSGHVGCRELGLAAADEIKRLRDALTAEAKRLDWLERNHTLHNSVAILYVVDGYNVQFSTEDGNNLVAETYGEDLRDAIDQCMEVVP